MLKEIVVLVLLLDAVCAVSLLVRLRKTRDAWGRNLWLVTHFKRASCPHCQGDGCAMCGFSGKGWDTIPWGHGGVKADELDNGITTLPVEFPPSPFNPVTPPWWRKSK